MSFPFQYPISFALNLAIPADKVLKTKQVYCATPPTSDGGMKETGGQGDEADTGRIQVSKQLLILTGTSHQASSKVRPSNYDEASFLNANP